MTRSIVGSTLTLALVFGLGLGACSSQERAEEMVKLRLDAEKAKELKLEVDDLREANEVLRIENQELKVELASFKGKVKALASQPGPSPDGAKAKPGKPRNSAKPSPADVATLRKQVTGGGSFK